MEKPAYVESYFQSSLYKSKYSNVISELCLNISPECIC